MKDKIFGVLQRVGRSFMLPIAILPVAGLLLGIGSSFTNATMIETYGLQAVLGEGTVLHGLLTIMSKAGSVIFDNLPLIFAVGVAIGMAKKEKEVAALAAMISFFVMHVSINAMLVLRGDILADGSLAEVTSSVIHHGEEQGIVLQCADAKISAPWDVKAEVGQANGFFRPGGNQELIDRLNAFYESLPDLKYEGHTGEIDDVLSALEEGRRPMITGEDGRKTVELISAIYKAGCQNTGSQRK